MAKEEFSYITFSGINHILKAEKSLKPLQHLFRLVPIPREISTDCGMCLVCLPENTETILQFLHEDKLGYEQIYTFQPKQVNFFRKLFT